MVNILIDREIENELKKCFSSCKSEVNIISAFCKVDTLKHLDLLIPTGVKKRLLVRFLPSDINSGATDKEIFRYCQDFGWKIYIDHTVHAKTYVFDRIKCILGSANLTNHGIGLSANSNKEASSFFEIDEDSYIKIMTLYRDSIELDEELYNYIISCTDDKDIVKHKKYQNCNKVIECLLPEDFPNKKTDIIELYNLKSFKWLIQFLSTQKKHYAYFGELTNKIHSVFIKEPSPFRKDIKSYLVELLSCISRLSIKEVTITRPNHSECIILAKSVINNEK